MVCIWLAWSCRGFIRGINDCCEFSVVICNYDVEKRCEQMKAIALVVLTSHKLSLPWEIHLEGWVCGLSALHMQVVPYLFRLALTDTQLYWRLIISLSFMIVSKGAGRLSAHLLTLYSRFVKKVAFRDYYASTGTAFEEHLVKLACSESWELAMGLQYPKTDANVALKVSCPKRVCIPSFCSSFWYSVSLLLTDSSIR